MPPTTRRQTVTARIGGVPVGSGHPIIVQSMTTPDTHDVAAVLLRHDCVHRNGLTTDGIRLTVFTKSYVEEIAEVMRSLVDRIEREIHGEQPPF